MAKLYLITHPATHRTRWLRIHMTAVRAQGLLSADDLARWVCDRCMAPLDATKPIYVIGGAEGMSVCAAHTPAHTPSDVKCCPCCSTEWDEHAEEAAKAGTLRDFFARLIG